jgi:hypothetical protein
VDPHDLDWRAMRLRTRELHRTVPMKLDSEVRKNASSAERHTAQNRGGRRQPREDRRTKWKTGTQKMRNTWQAITRWFGG